LNGDRPYYQEVAIMNPARQPIRCSVPLLCLSILWLITWLRPASAQTYSVVDLGTLGGVYSMAYGINASGTVVGVSALSSGRELPFFWNPSGIWTLSMPGSRFAVGRCINTAGQIAGYMDMPTGRQHAFLWSSTGVQDLGTLGGSDSFGYAINSGGQVVGVASTANGETHAFRWANGTMQEAAWAEGWALSLEDAIQFALEATPSSGEGE
jgi:probable HAF family extracellular repeat protein